MVIMKMRVGTCSMLFSTLCVVSGFFGWSQAFLQPSTIFTSESMFTSESRQSQVGKGLEQPSVARGDTMMVLTRRGVYSRFHLDR